MAANTTPIFPKAANTGEQGVLLSTAMANTKAHDGTEAVGTAKALLFTAGVDGSRIDSITVRPSALPGNAAAGTTVLGVIRFWLNNGLDSTVAANNTLLGEIAIPATAVTALATAVISEYLFYGASGLVLEAGQKIYAGLTVAPGGVLAHSITTLGGDY